MVMVPVDAEMIDLTIENEYETPIVQEKPKEEKKKRGRKKGKGRELLELIGSQTG